MSPLELPDGLVLDSALAPQTPASSALHYFSVLIYANDSKANGTLLATCTQATALQIQPEVNKAASCSLTMPLADANAVSAQKNAYIEVWAGYTSPQLRIAGYVQSVDKAHSGNGVFTVNFNDKLYALNHYRCGDALQMSAPHYRNIIDILNGFRNADGTYTPGSFGMLSESGFKARWVDQTGANSSPPGAGTDFFTANESGTLNLQTLAGLYALYYRLGDYDASDGCWWIDIGPLGDQAMWVDPSDGKRKPIEIFGGAYLAQQQGVPAGYENIADAQAAGLAVTVDPQLSDDLTKISNCIWAWGAGKGDTLVTLRGFFGDVRTKTGALAAGVTKAVYGHRTYYFGPTAAHWNGNTYRLVAMLIQNGQYQYGVANMTSIANYGLIENEYTNKHDNDPYVLLGGALGMLDYNSDPVPTWTFQVVYPLLDANGVPPLVKPGQTLVIKYKGQAASYALDETQGSPTYGQYLPNGTATFMDYPGVSTQDPNYAAKVYKLTRVIRITETFDSHGHLVTYEMGRGRWRPHHWQDEIARQFVRHQKRPEHPHTFKTGTFDGVRFLLSKTAHGAKGDAFEENWNHLLRMAPDSLAVSDVATERFFGEHCRGMTFTVSNLGEKQALDVLLAKPTDGTLTQLATGASANSYVVFRIAMNGSGKKSGFYSTWDGVNYTYHGNINTHSALFNAKGQLFPGTYTIKLTWSGGIWTAHIAYVAPDGSSSKLTDWAARWRDRLKVVSNYGAIGFHLNGNGGPETISIYGLEVHPVQDHTLSFAGGTGLKAMHVHEAGGAHIHALLDDVLGILKHTSHHDIGTGRMSVSGERSHGPFHPSSATTSSVTSATVNNELIYTVNLVPQAQALTRGGLKHGWRVMFADGSETWLKVKRVLFAADKRTISGFTTVSSEASGLPAGGGTLLHWDPLAETAGAHGNRATGVLVPPRPGMKNDPRAGWATVLYAADAAAGPDGSSGVTALENALVLYADGSLSKGSKVIIGPSGEAQLLANFALSGAEFAKGHEREGINLLDAGCCEAPATYSVYTGQTLTTSSDQSNSNYLFPSTVTSPGACWVDKTSDANTGIADAITALTTSAANQTVRLKIPVIQDPNGKARKYTPKANQSAEVPIYSTATPVATRLGGAATLVSVSGNSVTLDKSPAYEGAQDGDTWVLNPGGSNQQILTVATGGVDDAHYTLTFTAAPQASHAAGEHVVQRTTIDQNPTSSTYHQTVTVNGGGLMDGTRPLGAQVPNCPDVFYMAALDANGNSYGVYWGDASWQCPWTTVWLKHLGPLTHVQNAWASLHCKLDEMGLTQKGKSPVTIVGIELAAATLPGGTPGTTYVDGHYHGAATHPDKHPTTSSDTKTPPGDIKPDKIHPTHPGAHTHHHFYWIQKRADDSNKWHLQWEDAGKLVSHDSGKTFNLPIVGTFQEAPTGGCLAMPLDIFGAPLQVLATGSADPTNVANCLNHFIVFNTSTTGFWIKDPGVSGGKTWIPGYVAGVASTNTQTVGFAVVTEKVTWHGRKGSAIDAGTGQKVYASMPHWCIQVGKVDASVDYLTLEPPIKSKGGHGKQHGGTHRTGSHGREHGHPHQHNKYHFTHCTIQIRGSSSSPTFTFAPYNGSTPTLQREDGATWNLPTNSPLLTLSPGQAVWMDVPTVGTSLTSSTFHAGPNSTNFHLRANVQLIKVGYLSNVADTAQNQHHFHPSIQGAHETVSIHHAPGTHTKVHDHPHKGTAHTHQDTRLEVLGSLLYVNHSRPGNSADTTFNSTLKSLDGATTVTIAPGTLTVSSGDTLWLDLSGTQPVAVQHTGYSHTTHTHAVLCTVGPVDEDGNLRLQGWHHNMHVLHGDRLKEGAIHGGEGNKRDHHAPKSHSRRHDQPHKPSRHHHHGTSIECVGTTAYVNYAAAGGAPTFTSQIAVDDGTTYYVVQPATFTVVSEDYIYVETSGVTNGGNVTPTHSNSASFTPTDTQIILARISKNADAQGNYHTEGHHHGPHKQHQHHIKTSAIIPAHFYMTGATTMPGAQEPLWTPNGIGEPVDVNWHLRLFNGVGWVYEGAINRGNVTGMSSFGTNDMLEWTVYNQYLPQTSLSANLTAGGVTVTVPSTTGMFVGMQYVLNPGGGNQETVTVNFIGGTTTFNVDGTLQHNHNSGETITPTYYMPWKRVRPYQTNLAGQGITTDVQLDNKAGSSGPWGFYCKDLVGGTGNATRYYMYRCDVLIDGTLNLGYCWSAANGNDKFGIWLRVTYAHTHP